jgi:hypothetical protein
VADSLPLEINALTANYCNRQQFRRYLSAMLPRSPSAAAEAVALFDINEDGGCLDDLLAKAVAHQS